MGYLSQLTCPDLNFETYKDSDKCFVYCVWNVSVPDSVCSTLGSNTGRPSSICDPHFMLRQCKDIGIFMGRPLAANNSILLYCLFLCVL